MNKTNEMIGKVTTFIDQAGNLVVWRPTEDIDWKRLAEVSEEKALSELFEYQTTHGYDWLLPADFGGYLFSPILGWNVKRDAQGKFVSAEHIYRFTGYHLIDAIRKLKPGHAVVFYKAK